MAKVHPSNADPLICSVRGTPPEPYDFSLNQHWTLGEMLWSASSWSLVIYKCSWKNCSQSLTLGQSKFLQGPKISKQYSIQTAQRQFLHHAAGRGVLNSSRNISIYFLIHSLPMAPQYPRNTSQRYGWLFWLFPKALPFFFWVLYSTDILVHFLIYSSIFSFILGQ